MIRDWLHYLNNTQFVLTTKNLILAIVVIIGTAIFCVLMFWGLKKCTAFGKKIGYHVMSGNVFLFAIPIFLVLLQGYFEKFFINNTIMLVITIICWSIPVILNFIFCWRKFHYALAYTFFQFFFAFLCGVLAFSLVVMIILIIILLFIIGSVHSEYYNIILAPSSLGAFASPEMLIRARRNENNSNQLDGEHGEIFQRTNSGEYMIIFSNNSEQEFDLYRIYRTT